MNYGFKTQKTKSFWNSTSNWNQVCIGALACSALAIYGDGTNDMNTEAAFVLNNIIYTLFFTISFQTISADLSQENN